MPYLSSDLSSGASAKGEALAQEDALCSLPSALCD